MWGGTDRPCPRPQRAEPFRTGRDSRPDSVIQRTPVVDEDLGVVDAMFQEHCLNNPGHMGSELGFNRALEIDGQTLSRAPGPEKDKKVSGLK